MRNIREAKETDLSRVREIISLALRQCVVDSNEHYDFLYKDICSGLDWWRENKEQSLLLVCQCNNSILGFVLVKEYWNLSVLFVDPKHQGLGVGRDLVTSVIKLCKNRSPKACLRINSSNYAVPFYKKMGFTQTGSAIDKPGGCVPFEYNYYCKKDNERNKNEPTEQ